MKISKTFSSRALVRVILISFSLFGPLLGVAQESSEVEQLRKQLRELQDKFERMQREQREQIEALSRRLEEIMRQQTTGAVASTNETRTKGQNGEKSAADSAEKKRLEQELAAKLGADQTTPATPPSPSATPASSWSPSAPLTIARAGSAYMNISFDALLDVGWSTDAAPSHYLELGDHDPIQRGFSMRNAEIALDGAVDPYFKGFANVVFKLDQNNETSVELEETYLQTAALPANLQLKAGQFFAAFGRQNSQHPHQWAFVDEPVILARTLGPEGLRNLGAQVSWLAPTPFYTEAFLGVFNGQGGTAFSFRNPGDFYLGADRVHGRSTFDQSLEGFGGLLYVPRISSSFDLTAQQTLVVGASAAFGPNETGSGERTEIYGVDLYWKWKAPNAQAGFPFLSWQTEALYQNFEAGPDAGLGLPAETLTDWGLYSQLLWGFKPRWVAGLRGEYANGNKGVFDPLDVYRGERTRVSPDLSFYPSEFSKIRLQYNYDHGELFGTEHSVWLQLEFLLGAHGAHKF